MDSEQKKTLQYLAGSPVHTGHGTFPRNWTAACLAERDHIKDSRD